MIIIHTPTLAVNRQESFWYYGEHIATFEFQDGTKLVLEASGEQKVTFGEVENDEAEGITLSGKEAVLHAAEAEMTDQSLDNDENVFHMNNWFAIRKLQPNTTLGPDDDEAICHTYSDGIQKLLELAAEALSKEANEDNFPD